MCGCERDVYAPAVTTRRVDGALLRAHHEVVDVSGHEAETGGGDGLALAVLQLDGVLRLREHVERPRAHAPVGRHRDQVVGVLCAHHLHAVHRVLQHTNNKSCNMITSSLDDIVGRFMQNIQ